MGATSEDVDHHILLRVQMMLNARNNVILYFVSIHCCLVLPYPAPHCDHDLLF